MSVAARRFLRYQLPAIVWAGLILAASGDSFSTYHTATWVYRLIRSLFSHPISGGEFHSMHFAVRKIAHLVEYGTCSALMFRAVRSGRPVKWTARWALTAMAIATAVAGIDEFHQSFIPTRTGTLADVGLDATGAAIAQVLIRILRMLF